MTPSKNPQDGGAAFPQISELGDIAATSGGDDPARLLRRSGPDRDNGSELRLVHLGQQQGIADA